MHTGNFIRTIILAAGMAAAPALSQAGVFISVGFAPPVLPVYAQPICPGDGYIWTPGYWGYANADYYWVPGTWVLAPTPGFLWTPAWWGWSGGAYLFHSGYWGPHIGFYGGINYGFGYVGHGYEGGYWNHGVFQYNRSVNNVNVTNIHNVYNRTVVNNNVTRVSYNGGTGGIAARASAQEAVAEHEQHVAATQTQIQHQQQASTNRAQFASVNHGNPSIAATPRPAAFNAPGVVRGGGNAGQFANHTASAPANVGRPNATPSGAGQRFGTGGAPAAQQHYNAPAAQQHYNAPAAQQHYNAPAAQQHYNAPAAQQHYNAPAAQQHYNAPAARQNAPAPRAPAPHVQSAPRGGSPHGGGGPHGR